MEIKNAEKILIIRFSSLGDVLLTTPFLRVLKKKYPRAIIDYCVKSNFVDAVRLNPNVNNIYSWKNEEEFFSLIHKLKKNDYQFVIDLQNNFRSKKIVRKLKIPHLSFIKPNLEKFLLVRFKINLLKKTIPVAERYIKTVPELTTDTEGLELFISDEIAPQIEKNEKPFIGLVPGAFHFTKRWPLDYYAKLGQLLIAEGYEIAIFGGKSDREICKNLQKKINGSIDLSNDNNLFVTAANMKMCKAVVCNDSGLMHTATAVGTPVVSIFGSTVKEFGFAPYGVKNLVLEKNGLLCRPCSHIGRAKCKKKHFKCMNDILPEFVFDKTVKFVKEITEKP